MQALGKMPKLPITKAKHKPKNTNAEPLGSSKRRKMQYRFETGFRWKATVRMSLDMSWPYSEMRTCT